jgi:hypothetical protein
MRTPSVLLLAGALLGLAPLAAQGRLSKQDAERFQSKLTQIVEFGNAAPRAAAAKPRAIPVTDAEVNSYLRYMAADQIPVGIVEPLLNALGEGRVSGRAVVDLDAVRKQKQRGWLDPVNYLSGRLPVTAAGRLITKDGKGQFQLESAEISGVTVPKAVLQELVSYYSRTPENPAGIDMDAPFELPARIREIRVGSGSSTIVQ